VRHRSSRAGFSLVEVVATLSLVAILLTLAFTRWQGWTARQRLLYGTSQVATDLRQAQERAKAERAVYTVTFTGASRNYTIARQGGGFLENTQLPEGVTAVANTVFTFSAFGRPDAARSITIQNNIGTGITTVNAMGGISYQVP
jgi:prepilin-type N-terminal cleavage/methylation domain-containing protein